MSGAVLVLLWGTWASGPFQFYLKRETVVTMFIIINAILCPKFFFRHFFLLLPYKEKVERFDFIVIAFFDSLIWDRSRCK